MDTPETWADSVTAAALGMSFLCMIVFLSEAIIRLRQMHTASNLAASASNTVTSPNGPKALVADDASKVLEAAAKLVSAFAAATPGIAGLVAAILFLLAAAYIAKPPASSLPGRAAEGVDHPGPTSPSTVTKPLPSSPQAQPTGAGGGHPNPTPPAVPQ